MSISIALLIAYYVRKIVLSLTLYLWLFSFDFARNAKEILVGMNLPFNAFHWDRCRGRAFDFSLFSRLSVFNTVANPKKDFHAIFCFNLIFDAVSFCFLEVLTFLLPDDLLQKETFLCSFARLAIDPLDMQRT